MPGVCGNGSVPLSHSGNVATRIGIHTHTHTRLGLLFSANQAVITGLAPGCTCWKEDLMGTNENNRNLTKQWETTGDSCINGFMSNNDSLTEIGIYFAILIFTDAY